MADLASTSSSTPVIMATATNNCNCDNDLARRERTRKRALSTTMPSGSSSNGENSSTDKGKRRRKDNSSSFCSTTVCAKQDFDARAAQLLDTLHHNFARCLLYRRELSSSIRLTQITETLRQFVDSTRRLEWRIFWHDAYGVMCKILHFFDAPLNNMLGRNNTVGRLFCPTHLATIARTIKEQYGVSSTTLSPAYYTGVDNEYNRFYSTTDRPLFDEENIRVYKQMWSQMTAIATAFINVIWDAIEQHVRDPAIDYHQLCDYLRLMYETAMLGGHVLLATPLSQFASLRVVQTMNKMRLHELIQTLTHDHGYGLVYDTVIATTLVAAMHFAILLRGLRPAQLWPFADPYWPEFVRNNVAMTSYHFLSGLTGERLLLLGGRADEAGQRCDDYVAELKLKSAAMIASCIHDEYVSANETSSVALSEYLDLRSPATHLSGGGCLLSRNLKLAQRCYSCGSYSCGIVNPRYDRDYESDLDTTTNNQPAAAILAVQCNEISSTGPTSAEDSEAWWRQSLFCPLWTIVKSNHYGLEEKDALTDSNFINLAVLREHAHSNGHDAILDYQAFGLRSFPYNYNLSSHLKISRHLFVSHTSRLVTFPLPLSIIDSTQQ